MADRWVSLKAAMKEVQMAAWKAVRWDGYLVGQLDFYWADSKVVPWAVCLAEMLAVYLVYQKAEPRAALSDLSMADSMVADWAGLWDELLVGLWAHSLAEPTVSLLVVMMDAC